MAIKLFILYFLSIFLFISCNKDNELKNIEYIGGKTSYPIVLSSKSGQITIDKKPKKIMSLTLVTDEILFGLVSNDVYALSYLATNESFSSIFDKVSSNVKFVKGDNELILSLNPDLVFITSYISEDIKESIRKSGVVVYDIGDMNNIKEIENTIYNIGLITDTKDKAVEIINSMEQRLLLIENKLQNVTNKARVMFLTVNGYTAGKDTSFDEISKKAGAINVASELSIKGHTEIPLELLLKSDIDYIVISEYNINKDDIIKFFQNHEIYGKIKAVKEGRFIALPFRELSTISQYIIEPIEIIYKKLYENK